MRIRVMVDFDKMKNYLNEEGVDYSNDADSVYEGLWMFDKWMVDANDDMTLYPNNSFHDEFDITHIKKIVKMVNDNIVEIVD